MPVLGGVTCSFRREIRPYAPVEIWTRVLTWDEMWIFLISHFVKPETNKSSSSAKKTTDRVAVVVGDKGVNQEDVYATCISKYVLKQGRKTVVPEEFLRVCGLHDKPPAGGGTDTGSSSGVYVHQGQGQGQDRLGVAMRAYFEVERRRVRGLELAGLLKALDEGHKLFGRGSEAMVLAKF